MLLKGCLIVLTGPYGSGKTTLARALHDHINFDFAPTYTTRAKRNDEIHGVDYNFVTKNAFLNLILEDFFIEYVLVNDTYYGTPKVYCHELFSGKKNYIMVLNRAGALFWKKYYKNTNIFWIDCSSESIIEDRIIKRNYYNIQEIADMNVRFKKNKDDRAAEIASPVSNYIILNDTFDFIKNNAIHLVYNCILNKNNL